MRKIASILHAYRQLLDEVDTWFTTCLQAGGSTLACRGGCSACCRGLFDITLLDAWLLKEAFANLTADTRTQVLIRCQSRLSDLLGRWPGLNNPYFLNALPEEEWLSMPEADQTPCPLLDENGYCLVYTARPLTCRLHGLPNIDVSGEDFDGTVCTLHAGNPLSLPERVLRWRFREVFTQEVDLFHRLTKELHGDSWTELDTFIPLALLADYTAVDWRKFKL
ncbi:MAG: YkgJ family cysteine cluster protein [Desulfuromonadales bacterium]|nr:YkgJ family cysteine cluster protein [Desulfuromonadales bacterium]